MLASGDVTPCAPPSSVASICNERRSLWSANTPLLAQHEEVLCAGACRELLGNDEDKCRASRQHAELGLFGYVGDTKGLRSEA